MFNVGKQSAETNENQTKTKYRNDKDCTISHARRGSSFEAPGKVSQDDNQDEYKTQIDPT